MAIVQISQITNRKGLQVDLPQLAGAELGWSIDERRLFIGNGTLEEGAPVIGNTEILTEFSDILAFQTNYTYKGAAAGYVVQTGPTPSTPITQSLQSWLDQFATVKDFGAMGDGITDDTEAINRALYQLFCREINPQVRRSLFFPAGVYRVTETILIPPYATLWGEGAAGSVIRLDSSVDDSTLNAYVARTADSLQQYGVNIGTNGAITPQYVTISNMGFENLDPTTDVFLVQDATNCSFQNVSFSGPLPPANLITAGPDTACIRFASTPSLVCDQIVFDGCKFSGTTFGVNTDQQIKGTTFTNSQFDTLYQGVLLGTGTPVDGGPTGVRIVGNTFDNIYNQGIIFGDVQLNASGHNIFYDVGNHFAGVTNPASVIIDILGDNNVSISDLFARSDAFATVWARIATNQTQSISMINGRSLSLGQLTTETTEVVTLDALQVSPTAVFTMPFIVSNMEIRYTMTTTSYERTGVFTASWNAVSDINYTDDFTQNGDAGITLSATQSGGILTLNYTSGASSAIMRYNISYIGTTF